MNKDGVGDVGGRDGRGAVVTGRLKHKSDEGDKVMGGRNVPFAAFPLFLLALLAHAEGHHAPCEVFHALLVGELLLGLCKELPDLGGERVFGLHLVEAGAGGSVAVAEGREEGGAEQVVVPGKGLLEVEGAGGLHGRGGRTTGGGAGAGVVGGIVSPGMVGGGLAVVGSSRKAVVVLCGGGIHDGGPGVALRGQEREFGR